jgi:hypothetical protein
MADTRPNLRASMTIPTKSRRGGHRWSPKGELHPMAELTEAKVRSIRHELMGGASRIAVAAAYNVTPRTIRAIAERTRWGHVE